MGIHFDHVNVDKGTGDKINDGVGLVAATFPFNGTTGNSSLNSGKLYCNAVWLTEGTTLTTMWVWVESAASTVTLTRFGVYDADLNLVASTTNDTTVATSGTQFRSKDLTTPYVVPATGLYYFGLLIVASSAGSIARSGIITSSGVPRIGSQPYFWFAQSSVSDLPNPAVPGSGNGATSLWIGAE